MYYRVNTPRVAHETIDGETIIIDFESGSYYSVQEVGNAVWLLLDAGVARADLSDRIAQRYAGEPAAMAQAIDAFVEQLAQHALIVPTDNPSDNRDQTSAHVSGESNGQPTTKPFAPPALEQYSDMQELLLLDPIHEVDEQGWPMQKQ